MLSAHIDEPAQHWENNELMDHSIITYIIYHTGTFLSSRAGCGGTLRSPQHHAYKHTHAHTYTFKVNLVSMNRTCYQINY